MATGVVDRRGGSKVENWKDPPATPKISMGEPGGAPAPLKGDRVVRSVWQDNLVEEFVFMEQCLKEARFISMDTEFPGTIFDLNIPKHEYSSLPPAQHYALMKQNVDALKIIQLGLTLSDSISCIAWEFNFSDFDPDHDVHHPASVALLRSQGIDFHRNKRKGIQSRDFASHFLRSGLMASAGRAWVTFHGLYDFGFLIKILTRKALPDTLAEFMSLMSYYLGRHIYDLKPIARSKELYGGLENVARGLCVGRAAGKNHQAGSDSLLTMHVFLKLLVMINSTTMYFYFNYQLYGLTWSEFTIHQCC